MSYIKELSKKYRFELVGEKDNIPVFETRYYADQFIKNYLSAWMPSNIFGIDNREDGFYIVFKIDLQLDQFNEPMIRYR